MTRARRRPRPPLLDAIDPAVADVHPRRPAVLLHEAHDLADGAAAGRRGEAETAFAEGFECDRVVHVRRVRRHDHELPVEEYDLRIAVASAIESRKARPRGIP